MNASILNLENQPRTPKINANISSYNGIVVQARKSIMDLRAEIVDLHADILDLREKRVGTLSASRWRPYGSEGLSCDSFENVHPRLLLGESIRLCVSE